MTITELVLLVLNFYIVYCLFMVVFGEAKIREPRITLLCTITIETNF